MTDSVKITIGKAGKLKAKIKRIVPAVELALQKATLEAAQEVTAIAVREIEKQKTGRTYTRRRRNRQMITWQASAPGEAPAKKTGENIARIKAKKANRARKPGAKIVAPGIYRMLERGVGIGGTRPVAPRPLFGPALKAYREQYKDKLDDTVSKALGVIVRGGK